jgi:DNA-binding IclR family transcriptional regulator
MKKTTYSAPSVKKAFQILQIITDSSNGLGVSDLAKRLRIGKSTVHGITLALEELGALMRDPIHKKFTIGYTVLELGRKAYGRLELRDVARVPMEKLMETTGETVFLGTMNGDHTTILDVVESRNQLKLTSPPGTRLPLLAGALAKVFLAQLEETKAKEMTQRIGLVRYTSKSITDCAQLLSQVEEAKRRGYAIDDEEYLQGVRAVAAPIQVVSLHPAAIWVVGFSSTMDDKKILMVQSEIQKTAQEIRQSLGKAIPRRPAL